MGGSVEMLHHPLRCHMERIYFAANARYLIPGLLISLAAVVRCGFANQEGQPGRLPATGLWAREEQAASV